MSQTTLRQRMRYRFDSFMAKGGSSIFWSLFILFMALLILIVTVRGVVYLMFGEEGSQFGPFLRQIYIIFLELTDPGNMAQDIDSIPVYKITAILAGMAGVIIVSMLIAFITTSLDQKLIELKKGHSKVIEEDHTLLLGWNDRVVEILRELAIANESESDACVVVLSDQEKEVMDDFFRSNHSGPALESIPSDHGYRRYHGRKSSRLSQQIHGNNYLDSRSVIILDDACHFFQPLQGKVGVSEEREKRGH